MSNINSGDIAWVLISSALVLLMTPGLAFFYGGLVKRKNTVNTMMLSVSMMGLGAILWVLIGYSLSFSGDNFGVIGNFDWFGLNGVGAEPGPYAPTIPNLCFALFQMMFAILTPALITGAIAERMKFTTMFIFSGIWSIIVYYPLAHMVWGGGLLFRLGSLDFAGGNVVHISSGISALLLALILGKRKNFGKATYHPHNVPFVLLGAALLMFGWFGFNAGSALSANGLAVHAFMTTAISAAAALLSWIFIEKVRSGHTTLVGASTGLVIGLVAITPGAGFVPVWASIIIGLLVSPICYFFINFIKPKLGFDDALDVFGCHGLGGLWGCIATGLFAHESVNSLVEHNGLVFGEIKLFGSQILSIVITVVIAIVGTLIAVGIAKLCTNSLRVTTKNEELGLDVSEHGESAYPTFQGMDY